MKKHSLIITAVLAATVLMTPLAGAQEKVKEPKAPKAPMARLERAGIPGLTEDQKKQIEKLKLDLDKAVMPLENQIEVKGAELKGLLIADNPNLGAVNAKLDEIGAVRLQMQKKRVAHELDVRKLLTPEQRVQFDRRVLRGLDRMEGARGRGLGMRGMGGPGAGMGNEVRTMIRKRLGEGAPERGIEREEKIEIRKE